MPPVPMSRRAPRRIMGQWMGDLAAYGFDKKRGSVGRDGVLVQKPLAQAHSPERQADALFHFAVTALDPFSAAAADIEDEEVLAAPVRIGGQRRRKWFPPPQCRREAARESRGLRLSRPEKFAAVAAVAHRARRHGAEMFNAELRPPWRGSAARHRACARSPRAAARRCRSNARPAGCRCFPRAGCGRRARMRLRHDALDRIAAEIENGVTHAERGFVEPGAVYHRSTVDWSSPMSASIFFRSLRRPFSGLIWRCATLLEHGVEVLHLAAREAGLGLLLSPARGSTRRSRDGAGRHNCGRLHRAGR